MEPDKFGRNWAALYNATEGDERKHFISYFFLKREDNEKEFKRRGQEEFIISICEDLGIDEEEIQIIFRICEH